MKSRRHAAAGQDYLLHVFFPSGLPHVVARDTLLPLADDRRVRLSIAFELHFSCSVSSPIDRLVHLMFLDVLHRNHLWNTSLDARLP